MSKVRVTLNVFSGRPDPEWDLTEEEEKELRALLGRLVPVERPGMEQTLRSTLGYRGFELRGPSEDDATNLSAFRDHVVLKRMRRDPQSGRMRPFRQICQDTPQVERWLLKSARAHGYGEILDHFKVPRAD